MGNPRLRPQLLPQKLVLIRQHLKLTQNAIGERLDLSKRARVSEFEKGKRKPPLEVVLGYARLGRVPMESLVDDAVSLSRLGTFDYEQLLKIEEQAVERAQRKSESPNSTE